MYTSLLFILVGVFLMVYGLIGIKREKITVGHIKLVTVTKKTAKIWGISYVLGGLLLILLAIYTS
jgi:sulfite exporter TauE/SafE